ncbi:MAG TPA: hypothetical protein VGM24_12575, partial [Puia sp.]
MNRKQTIKALLKSAFFLFSFTLMVKASDAQFLLNSDSAFKAGSPNSGRIWGYAFGDYYYKAHSDSLVRGGSNQYTGVPKNRSAFAMRRIYLGYDYNISRKFSAELLLAAEDNFTQTNLAGTTTTSGDLLTNNKLSFYIKLLNIRWKNIWKGTDLVVGQVATPAFPLLSEKIWGYRSIERTIADIRRTPSYDLGVSLQGKFDEKGNYGYNLMVGNGSSAKPEGDNFKWFYGDVFAMFLDKKLVFDLYADYERLNWTPNWHHSRNMIKGYVAYTTPAFTVGVEGFVNNLKNDNVATRIGGGADTLSVVAKGISAYVHGDIVKSKLGFFARFDSFNPENKIDNNVYLKYAGNTGNYNDPSTKEEFITAGLDITPAKNVHFMPNVWY